MYKEFSAILIFILFISCSDINNSLKEDSDFFNFPDSSHWYIFDFSDSGLVNCKFTCSTFDSDSNIWFGFNSGLVKFNGKSWSIHKIENENLGYIHDIVFDSENNIWITTNKFGVLKFQEDNWIYYDLPFLLPGWGLSNSAYGIDIDSKGNIWIGLYWRGLLKFNVKNNDWQIFNYINTNLETNIYINCIYVENDSTIIIGTDRSGALIFDGQGNWKVYSNIPDNLSFSSIIKDEEENIWFGYNTFKLTPSGDWIDYTFWETNKSTNALAFDTKNNLWFVGQNLSIFNGQDSSSIDNPDVINKIHSMSPILIDKYDNKWIGLDSSKIAIFNENFIKP